MEDPHRHDAVRSADTKLIGKSDMKLDVTSYETIPIYFDRCFEVEGRRFNVSREGYSVNRCQLLNIRSQFRVSKLQALYYASTSASDINNHSDF